MNIKFGICTALAIKFKKKFHTFKKTFFLTFSQYRYFFQFYFPRYISVFSSLH